MTDIISSISTGIVVFIATNIDDIFILALLFAQVDQLLRRRHIVMGQYLGFSLLLLISTLGIWGNYFIPNEWIRLLGLIPIVIGLNSLGKNIDDNEDRPEIEKVFPSNVAPSKQRFYQVFLSPQTYGVVAITVANGSDNIGVYLPLFANTAQPAIFIIIGVFMLLVGVWCLVAYQLTQLPKIATLINLYGLALMPCILIGLGVFIVKENWFLTFLALGASYLWLFIFGHKQSKIA
jgi:cadmium resistance transport/sequestration family protein